MKYFLSIIDNKYLVKVFIISLFTALYMDELSSNILGGLLTYCVFFGLCLGVVFNILFAFKCFLIVFITIPTLPRNILDTYDALADKTVIYNTISSMPFAGISMIQWLTLIFLFSFIVLLLKQKIKVFYSYFFASLLLIITPSFITIIYTISDPTSFLLREVITSIRFPIYLCLGIYALMYIKQKKGIDYVRLYIFDILIISCFIMCFRIPVFMIKSLFEETPSLDLGILAGICFSMLFTLLLLKKSFEVKTPIIVIMLLSTLTPSRTYMAIFLACAFLYIILNKISFQLFFNIIKFIFCISLLLFILAFFNPRLYDFFLWKFQDFSMSNNNGVSDSGLVRVFEFLNIFDQLKNNLFHFLFGRGFCGYFTYESYPLPFTFDLDLKSYQEFELATGKYYHPHFFINVLLLKYGIVGLLFYIGFIAKLFINSWKVRKNKLSFLSMFYVYFSMMMAISFILDMFFRGSYAILFPFIIYIINCKSFKNENRYSHILVVK